MRQAFRSARTCRAGITSRHGRYPYPPGRSNRRTLAHVHRRAHRLLRARRKLDFMRAEPRVTFEVDRATAPDRWQSVVAEGTFEEITDPQERLAALRTLYPPPAAIPPLGEHTVVFRLRLTSKSGRYELPE
jgi:nitroimidazol reductase NimA-like FMN-containing flavoprotein (pyridoxamine 5'-phosphate oxidase superfamily)